MSQLDEYLPAALRHPRASFQEGHPYLFLLLTVPDKPKSADDWSFQTRTHVGPVHANAADQVRLSDEGNSYRVFALLKSSRNPWPDRISLGRARNNDVVLPDSSVSKLHAHFIEEKDEWYVVDAGSRNGTSLGTSRLVPRERQRLREGDILTIGALPMRVIDAATLHDLIHRLVRK